MSVHDCDETVGKLDELVDLGVVDSRSEATTFLMGEGTKTSSDNDDQYTPYPMPNNHRSHFLTRPNRPVLDLLGIMTAFCNIVEENSWTQSIKVHR